MLSLLTLQASNLFEKYSVVEKKAECRQIPQVSENAEKLFSGYSARPQDSLKKNERRVPDLAEGKTHGYQKAVPSTGVRKDRSDPFAAGNKASSSSLASGINSAEALMQSLYAQTEGRDSMRTNEALQQVMSARYPAAQPSEREPARVSDAHDRNFTRSQKSEKVSFNQHEDSLRTVPSGEEVIDTRLSEHFARIMQENRALIQHKQEISEELDGYKNQLERLGEEYNDMRVALENAKNENDKLSQVVEKLFNKNRELERVMAEIEKAPTMRTSYTDEVGRH